MKKTALIIISAFCLFGNVKSQEVNWRSLNDNQTHFVSANFGADYCTYYGLSYGYKFSKKAPIVVGLEMTLPFGSTMFDDWKIKLNAQTEVWHHGKFSLGVKTGLIFRRFESSIATLSNIGADITTTFGYYTPKFGLAGEIGYDKAISTHIRHGILKDYNPEIKDGWYGSNGGNFKFGGKASYTVKTWTGTLKAGKIFGQDFKNNPTLPAYLDVSLLKSF